jgi:hypothetical protein
MEDGKAEKFPFETTVVRLLSESKTATVKIMKT